jgi:hypothetical protein
LLYTCPGVNGCANDHSGDFADVPVNLLLCHSQILVLDHDVVRATILKVVSELLVKNTKKGNPVSQIYAIGGDGHGPAAVVAFHPVCKGMTKHRRFSVGFRRFVAPI